MAPTLLSYATTLALLISMPTLRAQEDASETAPTSDAQATADPAAVTANTTTDPAIPTDNLNLRLKPLTREELAVEVKAWQSLLKAKSEEVAEAIIDSRSQNAGDEKRAVLQQLSGLKEEKSALIARFEMATDAYELKGGDATQYQQYAAAVDVIDADVTDIRATSFMISEWLKSPGGGLRWGLIIARFLGILIVFWILSRLARKVVRKLFDRTSGLSELLEEFLYTIIGRVVMVTGLIIALGTAGVNVGAALALIGGGAFILAFALQDTLGNFANGMMLLLYRPFDVGDAVEVGGVTGKVRNVSLVSTTILTFDNKKVVVPNKSVWGQVITNITGMPTRRIDMIFRIGYDDDSDKAQAILEKVVAENELTLDTPAPVIQLQELADSSVNFICRPWVRTSDYLTVTSQITDRVKKEFDDAGISFPFPQQDIHVRAAGTTGGHLGG